MTQFRPGQRVKVVATGAYDVGRSGAVIEIRHDNMSRIRFHDGDVAWYMNWDLSAEPGIPGHLYPSKSERLPEWVGRPEWRR